MGLGITKPELLIIPLALILTWVALDLLALFISFRIYDRREARRRFGPGYRRKGGGQELVPLPPIQTVCQWCNGTGRLPEDLIGILKLDPPPEGKQYACPNCNGGGYIEVAADPQRWEALRRKLVREEWGE